MKMSSTVLMSLSALALAASACSTADGANWAGAIRDSAGVQIVENPATGLWTAQTAWRLVEDLRIGTAEGEPEYQFGNISPLMGITADESGRVFVLDQQGQHVKVFGPDGQWVRTIGRPGSGPGEIAAGGGGVFRTHGDTLVVYDAGNARLNRHLADGTFIGSAAFDFAKGIPLSIRGTAGGQLVAHFRQFPFPGVTNPDSMDHIVMLNPDGSIADSIFTFPSGRTFTMQGGRPAMRLFSPEPGWEYLSTGGVLFGVNNVFRLEVRSADGTLERVITKPVVPIPVTEADRETIREAMIRLIRASSPQVTAEQARSFASGVQFADEIPVFYIMAQGPEGSIWTQRVQVPSRLSADELENYNPQQDIGSPVWDVFDQEGRYLGEIVMPSRVQPMHFVGSTLYGMARDEFDVQYVVRLQIETNAN